MVQCKKILARWALIEPSRIGLASSTGQSLLDDRFFYLPNTYKQRIRVPSARIGIVYLFANSIILTIGYPPL